MSRHYSSNRQLPTAQFPNGARPQGMPNGRTQSGYPQQNGFAPNRPAPQRASPRRQNPLAAPGQYPPQRPNQHPNQQGPHPPRGAPPQGPPRNIPPHVQGPPRPQGPPPNHNHPQGPNQNHLQGPPPQGPPQQPPQRPPNYHQSIHTSPQRSFSTLSGNPIPHAQQSQYAGLDIESKIARFAGLVGGNGRGVPPGQAAFGARIHGPGKLAVRPMSVQDTAQYAEPDGPHRRGYGVPPPGRGGRRNASPNRHPGYPQGPQHPQQMSPQRQHPQQMSPQRQQPPRANINRPEGSPFEAPASPISRPTGLRPGAQNPHPMRTPPSHPQQIPRGAPQQGRPVQPFNHQASRQPIHPQRNGAQRYQGGAPPVGYRR